MIFSEILFCNFSNFTLDSSTGFGTGSSHLNPLKNLDIACKNLVDFEVPKNCTTVCSKNLEYGEVKGFGQNGVTLFLKVQLNPGP